LANDGRGDGDLRERSYGRLVAEVASRILVNIGCDLRYFEPR
jgi:hypothetical protein